MDGASSQTEESSGSNSKRLIARMFGTLEEWGNTHRLDEFKFLPFVHLLQLKYIL